VSTLVRSAAVAVIATIVLLLAGIYLPGWLLIGNSLGLGFEILGRTHPVFAAMVLVEPRRMDPDLVAFGWMMATACGAAATALVLRVAAARLPGRLLVQAGPSLLARCMARLDAFFERIDARRVRWLTPSDGVWESRVLLWKELRTRASGKLRYSVRVALVLLLAAAVTLTAQTGGMRIYGEFVWGVAVLVRLQAVVGGVSLFVQEKEGRQWDVLLSTPLSVRQILASKLAGGLVPLAPTALVGLLYLCAIAAFSGQSTTIFLAAAVPTAIFALFAYLVAAAASLRCATQRGAFTLTAVLLAVVLLAVPGFANAVLDFRHDERQELLAATNPAWYLDWVGDQLRWGYSYNYYNHVGPLDPLPIFAAVYAVVALLLLAWMLKRFNRLAGRTG
jgi:ABC-type transport system involved in multi-copper enzyme maturation permease subunit